MNQIKQNAVCAEAYVPRFTSEMPFLIEGCMIVQCTSGHASFSLNFHNYVIQAEDVLFLFNDMVVMFHERSEDFAIRYISIDSEKVFELYVNITSPKLWDRLYMSPIQHFKGEYKRQFDNWMAECIFVYNTCSHATSDPVISRMVILLFTVMEDFISSRTADNDSQLRESQWEITGKFLILLSRNYTAEHKVAYYANALCITPDYLSIVIKKNIGLSPKEIIERKLVLAMKALLENTTMSIKNIAQHLHYEDSSHLCRVFRRHIGHSPVEYRKLKQNHF